MQNHMICTLSLLVGTGLCAFSTAPEKKAEPAPVVVEKKEVRTVKKSEGNFFDIESEAQFNELVSSDSLVVVYFYSVDCVPCQRFGPQFKEIADNNPDVIFIKVEVNKLDRLSSKYRIRQMPTIQFFKNGSMVKQLQDHDNLRKEIKNFGA